MIEERPGTSAEAPSKKPPSVCRRTIASMQTTGQNTRISANAAADRRYLSSSHMASAQCKQREFARGCPVVRGPQLHLDANCSITRHHDGQICHAKKSPFFGREPLVAGRV